MPKLQGIVVMTEPDRERIGRLRDLAARLAASALQVPDPEMRRKMAQAATELGDRADALEKTDSVRRES